MLQQEKRSFFSPDSSADSPDWISYIRRRYSYHNFGWSLTIGEQAYLDRAKSQLEFFGKRKKLNFNATVAALQYVSLYEPEKLILEEYEIARRLFDQDSKLKFPTRLQVN